jgi:putative exosortase-associated protein (TIGR04073 family)
MSRVAKCLTVLAFIAALLATPSVSVAGHLYNKDDSNGMKIWNKFARGFINDTTFWLELPLAWYHYADQRDPFTMFFYGTADGIVKSGDRLGGGAYETVTFFIPSPRCYKPVLVPETLFED